MDVRSLPIHHDYFRRHFRHARSGSEAYGRWCVLDNAIMDLVRAAGMDLPFGPLPADEKMAVVGDAYFRMSMVDKYTLGDLEQNRRRCAQAQDRARHFNFPNFETQRGGASVTGADGLWDSGYRFGYDAVSSN